MAECDGLENRCTFTRTEGSNPSRSALEISGPQKWGPDIFWSVKRKYKSQAWFS